MLLNVPIKVQGAGRVDWEAGIAAITLIYYFLVLLLPSI